MTEPRRARATILAGWLFADLFLVLLIAALSGLPTRSAPVSPTPPPTVSPTAPARPAGLDPTRLDFGIPLSPDDFRAGARDELVNQVNAELANRSFDNRRIGFVIILARDDRDHAQRAVDTATDALGLLQERSPAFVAAQGLGYWNGNDGNFEFKIFFLD